MRGGKPERLTESQHDYLTDFHQRCFDSHGKIRIDIFVHYKNAVAGLEKRGYDVKEFRRYVDLYEERLNNLRNDQN